VPKKLIQGVLQFQSEAFPPLRDLFERLVEEAKPETLFITCADSRVDPTLLTQSLPGDMFVLRNAGNIIPPREAANISEAATVELAVSIMNVRRIVICGHSYCAAMRMLLKPDALAATPALSSWLDHAETTRRIVRKYHSHLHGDDLVRATVEENVVVQLGNLRSLPAVASRLVKGDLQLHGWVYEFETGEVFAYDAGRRKFLPLAEQLLSGDYESAAALASSVILRPR
jgi:carbonic anhydrase